MKVLFKVSVRKSAGKFIESFNYFSCMNDLSHIDPRYFDIVKSILFKSRHKLVDMKKVIRELGDELDIHTHCRNIIYSPYKEMTCLKNNSKPLLHLPFRWSSRSS